LFPSEGLDLQGLFHYLSEITFPVPSTCSTHPGHPGVSLEILTPQEKIGRIRVTKLVELWYLWSQHLKERRETIVQMAGYEITGPRSVANLGPAIEGSPGCLAPSPFLTITI